MSRDYPDRGGEHLRTRLRTLQIIVFAIAAGAAVFLIFAVVTNNALAQPNNKQPNNNMMLVLAMFAASTIVTRLFIPNHIVTSTRRRMAADNPPLEGEPLESALFALLQTSTIVAVALIESLALFAGVTYMLTRNPICLAVGVGCLAVILAHFPTRGSVTQWLENQRTRLESDRQMASLG